MKETSQWKKDVLSQGVTYLEYTGRSLVKFGTSPRSSRPSFSSFLFLFPPTFHSIRSCVTLPSRTPLFSSHSPCSTTIDLDDQEDHVQLPNRTPSFTRVNCGSATNTTTITTEHCYVLCIILH